MTLATTSTDAPTASRFRSDRIAAVAVAVVWCAVTLLLYGGKWGEDIGALYMAGHFWQTGQTGLIYAAPDLFFGGTPAQWSPEMAALGIEDKTIFPFVYAPLWAVLLGPLTTLVTPQGFSTAAAIVQFPLIALSTFLAADMARPRSTPLWQWVMLSLMLVTGLLPGIGAVHFVQPTITTTFLVILSVWCLGRNRPVTAGVALALAAALKMSPLLFAALFVIDRQWRALVAFAVAGALLGGASLLLAGPDLNLAFRAAMHHATENILSVPGNFTFRLVLTFAEALRTGHFDIAFAMGPQVVTPTTGLIDTLTGALSLGAIALVGWAVWRLPPAERRLRALIGLALIVPLFGPIGWMHYYLLPLLFAVALPDLIPGRAALVLLGVLGVMWLKPVFDLFKLFVPGQSIYVTVVCAALLILLVRLISESRARVTA